MDKQLTKRLQDIVDGTITDHHTIMAVLSQATAEFREDRDKFEAQQTINGTLLQQAKQQVIKLHPNYTPSTPGITYDDLLTQWNSLPARYSKRFYDN